MATSGALITQFGTTSGLGPRPWDTMLRSHRKEGNLPFGEAGRGQHSGHYYEVHLAHTVLGLGTDTWTDAGKASKIFGAMQYAATNPPGAETPARPDETLLDAVAKAIREAACYVEARKADDGAEPGFEPGVPTSVTLSLTLSRSARITWRHGKEVRTDAYVPSESYTAAGAVGRLTTIGSDLFFSAGVLLLDTWDRCGRPVPAATPSGSGDASATPGITNGETLPGVSPRRINQNYNSSVPDQHPDLRATRAAEQSLFRCGSGPIPQLLGATGHEHRAHGTLRE